MDKPSRPPVLGGITVKVVTGCGNMYMQLNWYDGCLFEVFATLGKGGGCAVCQSEAITRSITLGLKYGVPLHEYVSQLRGIRCPVPVPFPKDSAVTSCPDAIARTLESYGTLGIDAVVGLVYGANGHPVKGGDGVRDNVELSKEDAVARVQELSREREARGL